MVMLRNLKSLGSRIISKKGSRVIPSPLLFAAGLSLVIGYTALHSSRAADLHRALSERSHMSNKTYTKPADEELRRKLSQMQYAEPQHNCTAPSFRNEF